MDEFLLTVDALTVSIEDHSLFQPVSFQLQSGQGLQLLGTNGLGKTSLLRALIGLRARTSGQVLWNNQDIINDSVALYKALFYLGHELGLKAELTAWENIRLDPNLQACSRDEVQNALTELSINKQAHLRCGSLSRGQKQRVALCKLLLTTSAVLILDEPFSGLDQSGMALAQKILVEKCQQGHLLILTSHRAINLPELKLQTLCLTGTNACGQALHAS